MATVSISIPDAVAPRVLDAIATAYGYDPSPGDPNATPPVPAGKDAGKTKAQFARSIVARFLTEVVAGVEGQAAAQAAAQTTAAKVASEITIS